MKWLLKFLAIMFPFFVAGSAGAVGFQYLSIPDDIGRPIELGYLVPKQLRRGADNSRGCRANRCRQR
jgi:hypothetical protein